MKRKNIVVIGGGTGTFTVLSGLKKYPVNLSVVVSMMDSGGSNRVIRDEFGLLPTSDIRQCMVALASQKSHELLRQLFTYRFSQGTGISGMTFGNLFMAALTDIYKSQEEAIKETCSILDVQGQILPVTYDDAHLVARYENGKQVLGEHFIDEPDDEMGSMKIAGLELIPEAVANKKAIKAIKEADLIVLGPGDLYTSIVCNFLVKGILNAIKKSKAKKVYVVNLMTKFGQTNRFKVSDFVSVINGYLGKGNLDYCLINRNGKYSQSVLRRYRQEKASPVEDDSGKIEGVKVVKRSLVSNKIYEKAKGDKLKRSFIRHDKDKLAKALISLA